jgi:hypothetical protein
MDKTGEKHRPVASKGGVKYTSIIISWTKGIDLFHNSEIPPGVNVVRAE